MKFFTLPCLMVLTVWALSGCALAPGVYGGGAQMPSGFEGGSANDVPPPGALLSITPELLQQQRAQRLGDVPASVQQLFAAPKPYTIGSGDIVNIVVWDHPQLTLTSSGNDVAGNPSSVGNGYNVNVDGRIQFPYVGEIKLAGLTESQAREVLVKALSKIIKDPNVTLRIQSYRSGRVYIDGEVRSPGLQVINDIPMTLPEAISRAGGYTPLADRSAIAITRQGVTTMVSIPQLTAQGINPAQILLMGGDLVRVMSSEESKVFVLGEVLRPSSQPLRNGRLTLNEALGEAGGVSPSSADPSQIFVVRTREQKPEIFHLDAKSPQAFALAEGFELQPRDVVYVDPVPLVRWNRVITLILPSAQAANVTRTATGN